MIEAPARRPVVADEPASSSSAGRLRWVLGWIVLPGSIIAALFLAGVHVGARGPDRALARLMLSIFGSEPGVATEPEPPEPSKPRPGAKPGETFSFEETQRKKLEAAAEKRFGLGLEDLDCEDICRAAVEVEYGIPVFIVEHCEFAPISLAPTRLHCRGKLEAVDGPRTNDRSVIKNE